MQTVAALLWLSSVFLTLSYPFHLKSGSEESGQEKFLELDGLRIEQYCQMEESNISAEQYYWSRLTPSAEKVKLNLNNQVSRLQDKVVMNSIPDRSMFIYLFLSWTEQHSSSRQYEYLVCLSLQGKQFLQTVCTLL